VLRPLLFYEEKKQESFINFVHKILKSVPCTLVHVHKEHIFMIRPEKSIKKKRRMSLLPTQLKGKNLK
jgi:hypothetical protein